MLPFSKGFSTPWTFPAAPRSRLNSMASPLSGLPRPLRSACGFAEAGGLGHCGQRRAEVDQGRQQEGLPLLGWGIQVWHGRGVGAFQAFPPMSSRFCDGYGRSTRISTRWSLKRTGPWKLDCFLTFWFDLETFSFLNHGSFCTNKEYKLFAGSKTNPGNVPLEARLWHAELRFRRWLWCCSCRCRSIL